MDSGFYDCNVQSLTQPQVSNRSVELESLQQTVPAIRTMSAPLAYQGFVTTRDAVRMEEMMTQPKTKGIVISGKPGSGKSCLAEQSCYQLFNGYVRDDERLFHIFNCQNLESLYSDMQAFYDILNVRQPALAQRRTWNIIQVLHRDMSGYYGGHHKIFIFDDAEDVREVLQQLETICGFIGEADNRYLWKFLVTTQKKVQQQYRREYKYIGTDSFIDLEGFEFRDAAKLFETSDVDDEMLQKIMDQIGNLPLALGIFKQSLSSNQLETDTSRFIGNYLNDIETEARAIQGEEAQSRSRSALSAIKLSINRLLQEFQEPLRTSSEEVIKIISFYNEKSISKDLLIAAAETVTDNPDFANIVIQRLTTRLVERNICFRRIENKVPLFNLHKLVKIAMRLFINEDEKIELLQKALIALNRVIPRDGRKHQTRLLGFYADHAESLDQHIYKMSTRISRTDTPFLLYLHCELLVGMGYCLISLGSSFQKGLGVLNKAKDKFCELVLGDGRDYKAMAGKMTIEANQKDKEIAKKLYDAALRLPMITSCGYYKAYISKLPLYHRITEKDLDNMTDNVTENDLVNGHLTEQRLQKYREINQDPDQCRVIDDRRLAQVMVVELLAEIYCVLSKVYRKETRDDTINEECIYQAEAALEVYNRIYNKFNVYLLAAVITEREMLTLKTNLAQTVEDVQDIVTKFEQLSKVGQDQKGKRLAFEAGLIKSDMSKDHYHELVCLEATTNCYGRLDELSNGDAARREQNYNSGMGLLQRIEQLACSQVYPNSALCYSYKNFAKFLAGCKKYDEAVTFIIKAMHNLHIYLLKDSQRSNGNGTGNGAGNSSHPEFDSTRFTKLYKDIEKYYDMYKADKQDGRKILRHDSDEYQYLREAMDGWAGSGENQPSESNTKFQILETIVECEVEVEDEVAPVSPTAATN